MLNAFLVSGCHFLLDGVHDILVGVHHLRGGRTKQFLDREPFFSLPFIDAIVRTHLRLKSVVQCLSCAGFLHASYHAAAAVHFGVENSKRDNAATVAEVDGNLTIAATLDVVDILCAVGKFAAADGIFLRDCPLRHRFSGGSGASQRRSYSTIGISGNSGEEGRHPVKSFLCNVNGDASSYAVHHGVRCHITHSSIASSSTRSIPISQTEDAT